MRVICCGLQIYQTFKMYTMHNNINVSNELQLSQWQLDNIIKFLLKWSLK